MNTLLTYISENKEWIFSGIGVSIIGAMYIALRMWVHRRSVPKHSKSEVSELLPDSDMPKTEEPHSNTVEYIANIPLDPNITSDELAVLKRFSEFPRSQYTQGYRLDWIYKELISDIPESTLHLFLENLFSKGYLAKHRTSRGNVYYRISNNGARYLVDNKLIRFNDAQQVASGEREIC